jgi:hypothetical protein
MIICSLGIKAAISKLCLYYSLRIILMTESRHLKLCSVVMGARFCQTLRCFLDHDARYRRFGGIIASVFGDTFMTSGRRWEGQRLGLILEDLKLRGCQKFSKIFILT